MERWSITRRLLACCLAFLMALLIVGRVVALGQVATWDCVWFGSYPQSYVDDASTVATLDAATGWDAHGDLTLGGVTYRRLAEFDATHSVSKSSDYWTSHYWVWGDKASSAGYCYFRYEPVKWRVLKVNGDTGLAVTDVAIDCQRYNTNRADVTWETSSVRSWLNGYGASYNQPGTNFSLKSFISTAFSTSELDAVPATAVANADNTYYGTTGGNDTSDRVFLLSEAEAYDAFHGFSLLIPNDEACRCKPSDYACAMGAYRDSDGNCDWWLRSPGYFSDYACSVNINGVVSPSGDRVGSSSNAVRPALNLDLSSPHVAPAGTVSSDGTVDETATTGGGGGTGDDWQDHDVTLRSNTATTIARWSDR